MSTNYLDAQMKTTALEFAVSDNHLWKSGVPGWLSV